jgi:hypothetical protein
LLHCQRLNKPSSLPTGHAPSPWFTSTNQTSKRNYSISQNMLPWIPLWLDILGTTNQSTLPADTNLCRLTCCTSIRCLFWPLFSLEVAVQRKIFFTCATLYISCASRLLYIILHEVPNWQLMTLMEVIISIKCKTYSLLSFE